MSETTASATRTADVIPTLRYRDARAALRWLHAAFGLEEHLVHEGAGGRVEHAELRWGNGFVMLGSQPDPAEGRLQMTLGTASIYLVADDGPAVDALHERAVAAGAEIVMPPTDQDYGSRDFVARDPEGHYWSFGT
jgi:uncharacterized glyoxalase superfamily protein PhnB